MSEGVSIYIYTYMYVCLREWGREKERVREKEREREGEKGRKKRMKNKHVIYGWELHRRRGKINQGYCYIVVHNFGGRKEQSNFFFPGVCWFL